MRDNDIWNMANIVDYRKFSVHFTIQNSFFFFCEKLAGYSESSYPFLVWSFRNCQYYFWVNSFESNFWAYKEKGRGDINYTKFLRLLANVTVPAKQDWFLLSIKWHTNLHTFAFTWHVLVLSEKKNHRICGIVFFLLVFGNIHQDLFWRFHSVLVFFFSLPSYSMLRFVFFFWYESMEVQWVSF